MFLLRKQIIETQFGINNHHFDILLFLGYKNKAAPHDKMVLPGLSEFHHMQEAVQENSSLGFSDDLLFTTKYFSLFRSADVNISCPAVFKCCLQAVILFYQQVKQTYFIPNLIKLLYQSENAHVLLSYMYSCMYRELL